jgi:hypothetical protein
MRLTKEEIRALIDIVNERLAGGDEDMRDALGVSLEEAERISEAAERAISKLAKQLATRTRKRTV